MNAARNAMHSTMQPVEAISRPWWREAYVWLLISGPATVVVAGIATAIIAWDGADTVVSAVPVVQMGQEDAQSMLPAQVARNRVGTPAGGAR